MFRKGEGEAAGHVQRFGYVYYSGDRPLADADGESGRGHVQGGGEELGGVYERGA